MHLDELERLYESVGYGSLGCRGSLGYEDRPVVVGHIPYGRALSAHPPSELVFRLDGRFAEFRCRAALNDDVLGRGSHADFAVLVDGHVAAVAAHVFAGESPCELQVSVRGAATLALVVQTSHWECSHAVWLDPELLETETGPDLARPWTDALVRVEVDRPPVLPRAEICIATLVTPGYAHLLDDMLGSLQANGACPHALVAVLVVDGDAECYRVVKKYGAMPITCRARVPLNTALKSALYSVASLVDAERYLCLDADTLVLDELRPIFAAGGAFPPGTILLCRDAFLPQGNLVDALNGYYGGGPQDLEWLLGGASDGEASYPLVVNDGMFAGDRRGLLAIENLMRRMPGALAWLDQHPGGVRNQFIFNLALARLECAIEVDPTYNLQVHVHDVQMTREGGAVRARWRGRNVRVLHFCGWGRDKYPAYRGVYAGLAEQAAGAQP